jgi:hypothetical protein
MERPMFVCIYYLLIFATIEKHTSIQLISYNLTM